MPTPSQALLAAEKRYRTAVAALVAAQREGVDRAERRRLSKAVDEAYVALLAIERATERATEHPAAASSEEERAGTHDYVADLADDEMEQFEIDTDLETLVLNLLQISLRNQAMLDELLAQLAAMRAAAGADRDDVLQEISANVQRRYRGLLREMTTNVNK